MPDFELHRPRELMKKNRNASYNDMSDYDLWEAFRQGSDGAFDLIYQRYFDALYRYGRQFTANMALVEDAIQEMFIEIRRRRSYLSSTDKILPYLFLALRRKIIRLREKIRREEEFDVKSGFEITLSVEDEILSKELEHEHVQQLRSALEGLSEKHREVIYYFYYENLSYSEIQTIIGFDNVKSVRNLLYKALKSLRKSFTILFIVLLFKNYSVSAQS